MSARVLVTGGSGFVASHLIEQMLLEGHTVNTTVRSRLNQAKVNPRRAVGAW